MSAPSAWRPRAGHVDPLDRAEQQRHRVDVDLDLDRLIPERRRFTDRVDDHRSDGHGHDHQRRSRARRAGGGRSRGSRAWVATCYGARRHYCRAVPLEEYKRKRDFEKTPEPAGGAVGGAAGASARAADSSSSATARRRLHYDFRLEIDGVLVSWAVPKGPTLDPSQRRMAVHVEDHPIEYFDFEGVIPKGEYGGGDVIVWDWGTWQPEAETPDGRKAVEDGELKFTLHGEKLRGRFTIVRTSGRGVARRAERREAPDAFEDGGGEQWLLIHKRDDAPKGWDAEDHPQSVKTGRTNDEVKERRDAIWISQAPAALAEIDLVRRGGREAAGLHPADGRDPRRQRLHRPGLAVRDQVGRLPGRGGREGRHGAIYTRNGNDAETYFPKLARRPSWIDAQEAIVDGEVVAIDEDGMPDFSLLQELTTGESAPDSSTRRSTCSTSMAARC